MKFENINSFTEKSIRCRSERAIIMETKSFEKNISIENIQKIFIIFENMIQYIYNSGKREREYLPENDQRNGEVSLWERESGHCLWQW